MVCREFGPGEVMRCPAPSIERRNAPCEFGLGRVGRTKRAHVCMGKDLHLHGEPPDEERTCKHCKAPLGIWFRPASEERHAQSA